MPNNDAVIERLLLELNDLRSQVNELSRIELLSHTGWTDWTPTLTQSVGVTATIHEARYKVLEKVARVQCRLAITSAGTIANGIIIGGQPAAIQPAAETLVGTFLLLDAGTAYYIGGIRAVTATNWQMFAHNQASSVGAAPSFALASGDALYFQGSYRIP